MGYVFLNLNYWFMPSFYSKILLKRQTQATASDLPFYNIFAPQKVPLLKISDDVIACDLWFEPPNCYWRIRNSLFNSCDFRKWQRKSNRKCHLPIPKKNSCKIKYIYCNTNRWYWCHDWSKQWTYKKFGRAA